MRRNIFIIATVLVFLVSLVFRFWKLSSYPVSLSMDEIAIGYDSYSLLNTGKDQYGKYLPLSFRSVGDYKTPVLFYLVAGSIKIFGENEVAVRFPSALIGALTSVVFILLLQKLKLSRGASILGGLWLSVSPWHVFLSRTSFDGVVALFFLISGIYVFLKFTDSLSTLLLSLSIVLFSLSAWSYHAERVFVPIITLFLFIYFRKKIKVFLKNPKNLFLPVVLLLTFITPFVYTAVSSAGISGRATDLWLGKDSTVTWAGQYMNYFDFWLWFARGLNFTPDGFFDVGFLYYADFPLLILGINSLIKSKNKFLKALAIFWFFLGAFPGSLTRGGVNAGRTLVWLPFFGLAITASFEYILSLKKKTIFLILVPFYLWNIGYFVSMFTINFPKYYGDLWHYGYKEVAQYVCQNYSKYDKVIITDKYGSEWPSVKTIPYLYILFYCNWDPKVYLSNKDLYNIEMRQPQWRIDSKEANLLLIGSRWDFPEGFDEGKIMKKIYFPSGKAAFYFVETKE